MREVDMCDKPIIGRHVAINIGTFLGIQERFPLDMVNLGVPW
jgi:hypothetical protein